MMLHEAGKRNQEKVGKAQDGGGWETGLLVHLRRNGYLNSPMVDQIFFSLSEGR